MQPEHIGVLRVILQRSAESAESIAFPLMENLIESDLRTSELHIAIVNLLLSFSSKKKEQLTGIDHRLNESAIVNRRFGCDEESRCGVWGAADRKISSRRNYVFQMLGVLFTIKWFHLRRGKKKRRRRRCEAKFFLSLISRVRLRWMRSRRVSIPVCFSLHSKVPKHYTFLTTLPCLTSL